MWGGGKSSFRKIILLTKQYLPSFQFYWRDWMVIAADTYGHDKLKVHACEYNQQNNHGRSILLASVDKSKGRFNGHNAVDGTTGLRLYRYMYSE